MRRSSGFTLLEVMVAMTITALALGGLFSVIAGNKRLAGRAEAALLHGIEVRSLINSAQLNDAQGEVFTETRKDKLKLETDEKLETPARKTKATTFELRKFHLKDEHGAELVSGSYWMKPELPETPPEVALEPEPAQPQGAQQGGNPNRNFPGGNPNRNFPGGNPNRNFPGGNPNRNFPGGNPNRNFPGGNPNRNFPGGNPNRNFPAGQGGNQPGTFPPGGLPR